MNRIFGRDATLLEGFITAATTRTLDGQLTVAAKLKCEFGLSNCVFSQEAISAMDAHSAGYFTNHFTESIAPLWQQYLEERLQQQIAAGCRQIVILNAGDSFLNQRVSGVRYFEIGQTAAIQQKLSQVSGNDVNTTYIAEDYLQPNLIERLNEHQFDIYLPTYFVWMSSVSVLKRGTVIDLLDTLRNQICRFHVSFDYFSHQSSDRATSDSEFYSLVHLLEPLEQITIFKDIATFTKGLGLELLEAYSMAQLRDRYSPQSPLSSPLLHGYSVCTIAKPTLKW
jgi:O-methyltransferase involved in polyketide biosynthesis